jgi:hypothetical protein
MRRPHPTYEMFIKDQQPKYGKTFVQWFLDNEKIGNESLLKIIGDRTYVGFEYDKPTYYRDFLAKKLQLISTIFNHRTMESYNQPTYGLDKVADIMDIYEEGIQLICTKDNVAVTAMPSGIIGNGQVFSTEYIVFDNFGLFQDFLWTGFIIIYNFVVNESGSISIRAFKHEALTREVLFEKYK